MIINHHIIIIIKRADHTGRARSIKCSIHATGPQTYTAQWRASAPTDRGHDYIDHRYTACNYGDHNYVGPHSYTARWQASAPTDRGLRSRLPGLNSYGLCSHGLCSYGLCSCGLYSYGLYIDGEPPHQQIAASALVYLG